jgi:hypothetical protein
VLLFLEIDGVFVGLECEVLVCEFEEMEGLFSEERVMRERGEEVY